MTPAGDFQIDFLEKIIARFPSKLEGVDTLCVVLNLSRDPIYRRIRGETALTPTELTLLARKFDISIDQFVFGKTSQVICSFNAFSNQVRAFSNYLEHYKAQLLQLNDLPNVHMYYTSAEIPVFSYMYFPDLICFKLYVWGRTTWDLPFLQNRKFSFDLVPPHDLAMVHEIVDLYNNIPSTELWSLGIVDNTLAQIEYHLYSNGFDDGQIAMHLCDRMLDWAAHLKNIAAAGRKFSPARSEHRAATHIFHNEMVYTNNTVLVKSAKTNIFFAAMSNPDFITSFDVKLCNHMDKWFANILSKSTNITLESERNREWFFRLLVKKIDTVRKRIELFLGAE